MGFQTEVTLVLGEDLSVGSYQDTALMKGFDRPRDKCQHTVTATVGCAKRRKNYQEKKMEIRNKQTNSMEEIQNDRANTWRMETDDDDDVSHLHLCP